MLKYIIRWRVGWWILHILVIGLTLYLGHLIRF